MNGAFDVILSALLMCLAVTRSTVMSKQEKITDKTKEEHGGEYPEYKDNRYPLVYVTIKGVYMCVGCANEYPYDSNDLDTHGALSTMEINWEFGLDCDFCGERIKTVFG